MHRWLKFEFTYIQWAVGNLEVESSPRTRQTHSLSHCLICLFQDTRTRPVSFQLSLTSHLIRLNLFIYKPFTMRKSAADRFRHLFNRSLLHLRHNHHHHYHHHHIHHHPLPSFSHSRFLSSMASDSPFPVTVNNINPKVCFFASIDSPFTATPDSYFHFFASGCAKVASF